MLDSLANCVRERAKNGNGSCILIERGLNGNGRSVARTGYGNFLLTPTVVCATEAETGLPTSQFSFSRNSEASYNEMAPPFNGKVFSFHLASLCRSSQKLWGSEAHSP